MKVVNARTGRLQPLPFSLGEEGRARHLEEIQVHPTKGPEGPEVGYVTYGEGHVALTRPNPAQEGILLRIDTKGVYTRGTSGWVKFLGGEAEKLATGRYAFGDAGRTGGGSDELWHVKQASWFSIYLCGGEDKGYGHRLVIITRSFRVVMLRVKDLEQRLAIEGDPEITEALNELLPRRREWLEADLVRLNSERKDSPYDFDLSEGIRGASAELARLKRLKEALDLTDRIEDAFTEVTHCIAWGNLREWGKAFGLTVHPSLQEGQGVEIRSGTLVPGNQALFEHLRGASGRRNSYQLLLQEGLAEVMRVYPGRSTKTLYTIEAPNWRVAEIWSRDGEVTKWRLFDARGEHILMPSGGVTHNPWPGLEPNPASAEELGELFGVKLKAPRRPGDDHDVAFYSSKADETEVAEAPSELPDSGPVSDDQMAALLQQFGRR